VAACLAGCVTVPLVGCVLSFAFLARGFLLYSFQKSARKKNPAAAFFFLIFREPERERQNNPPRAHTNNNAPL
jgi:hypothetical protein